MKSIEVRVLIQIPDLQAGDFIIVHAEFKEYDGDAWYPLLMLEPSAAIPKTNETKESYYYSHFKMAHFTSDYDLNRRFKDYRSSLLRHYKERAEQNKKGFGWDNHDYIGADIEMYRIGGGQKWPYESGNFLRLHGKNDKAHYFFEFTLNVN